MKRLLDRINLRDPVWQAIGTLIGVFAIVISTFVAYDVYRRSVRTSEITVSEYFYFDPLRFGEAMKGRVALMVDGAAVESVVVYYYGVANTGQNPIYPNDYVKPLQVSINVPWQLLAVETESSVPPEMQVKWTRVTTNTFEMEPSLLNPQDTINVFLFMTNPIKTEEPPKPSWSARIANVRSVKFQPRQSAAEQTGLGLFYVGISHSGWNVYWLAAVAILLFTIGVLYGTRSGRLAVFSIPQVVTLTALMAFSFSSAEIMVSAVIEGRTQPLIAWVAVGLHFLLVLYLAWPLVRKLRLGSHRPDAADSAQV